MLTDQRSRTPSGSGDAADESLIWGASGWLPVAGQFGELTLTPIPGDFASWIINGNGDDVVALTVPGDDLAILRFTYDGLSNFVAWSLDGTFDKIDLLVNEIGSYHGARPVNTKFLSEEPIRHLDMTASDVWRVDVEPLSLAVTLSGAVSGTSDDVVQVANTGKATFTYEGSSNFIVWARHRDGQADLLVNKIGDNTGTHVIPVWTEYLDIVGIGDWSVTLVP
jgi:hypothetical protein